jgi:hypothetical protein
MTEYYPMMRQAMFGGIYNYLPWGITFTDYLTKDYSEKPVMKVWTAR